MQSTVKDCETSHEATAISIVEGGGGGGRGVDP